MTHQDVRGFRHSVTRDYERWHTCILVRCAIALLFPGAEYCRPGPDAAVYSLNSKRPIAAI